MTDPGTLSIKDYSYSLAEQRIAKYPLAKRDAAKLLIYDKGKISEDIYQHLADHIPSNSLLVFNDTKVVEARLLFQKPSGGTIEIFCLEPHQQYADITTAMLQHEKVLWHCLIGGASKWKHGQILEKKTYHNSGKLILTAKYIEKAGDSFLIELSWNDTSLSFAEILHLSGAIPLPPYLKRAVEQADAERYQTVYARREGSVAAPTAGLHFTDRIFEALKQKNIDKDFVTLHVGAGTFKPVKSETMEGHEMHAEHFTVSKPFIQNLIEHLDKNIIAVGTTSLRTLESLYWLGVKKSRVGSRESGEITQWEGFETNNPTLSSKDALTTLLQWMDEKCLTKLVAKTRIMVVPGYQFKIVNGLITNFHQPQSTLLLLVAAFTGDPPGATGWRKIYQYALNNNFRFLSYGDGSLLWRNQA